MVLRMSKSPVVNAALLAFAFVAFLSTIARADETIVVPPSGIVKVKSDYSVPETIARIKKDVADKGIRFFQEIDQQKLAADAGIKLNPSTLLVFGNPPLGTQFMTVVLSWLPMIPRIGDAMSAGERPAVAT